MSRGPFTLVVALATLVLGGAEASAQQLETGLHYYAVENVDQRQVTERGTAGASGIAFTTPLVLSPDTNYRIWILQAASLDVAWVTLKTGANGTRTELPPFVLRLPSAHDTDSDDLHDLGEQIVGTSATTGDTDGDGVPDGQEVRAGTNPLDGVAARTGIIASADTPGVALDVCAANDLVAVADGPEGVTVFNAFNALSPVAIARVDTQGNASRIACSGTRLAVADGPGGLAVIDIADPPSALVDVVVNKFLLGGEPTSVVAVDRVAFVGLSSGNVVSVDLRTGSVLERVAVGSAIADLVVEKDTLFVLDQSRLYALPYVGAQALEVQASLTLPPGSMRRLYVGDGVAYAAHSAGVHRVDVSDPAQPNLIAAGTVPGATFDHVVLNGAGLAVGINGVAGGFGRQDVHVYDAADPATVLDELITIHQTPGRASAVALYDALAYVADQQSGLQVLRLLPQDIQGQPPSIALSTSFGLASAEEGKLLRVTAEVNDDTMVRNVEFFLNGERVLNDGGFPFELVFTAPRLSDQESFRLRARATDTGGNATFTQEYTIQVTPDATAPMTRAVVPRDGALLGTVATIAAFVDEPLDPQTLSESSLTLLAAGPDRSFGTGDDVLVPGGAVEFRESLQGAFRSFAPPLPPGRYRAQLTTDVTDLKGNPLASAATWTFEVFDDSADADGDGVPDALEAILGLDPNNPDSDGDGTLDGLEDFDGDGLVNRAEVLFGTDVRSVDSDGDGIPDGDEDQDYDFLVDRLEFEAGTDPFDADSDNDLFFDGDEHFGQSDPLDPSSIPLRFAAAEVVTRNEGPASLGEAVGEVVVKNDGPASLTEAVGGIVVKNEAAPEATSGQVEGRAFTVENQGQ